MATSPTPSSPARSSSTTRSQMRCPARLPLVCVVAVAPGLLICLVGFLAWSVPMLRLSRHVHPLAGSVRCQAQNVVVRHVRHTWDAAYADLWERQRRWAAGRQPTDAVAEVDYIIRSVAPTFLCNSLYLGGSILTLHGNCTHLFALVHHTLGWFADRQNCTHRWFEWWDPDTQALTGIVFYSQPASPYAMLGLEGAIRATTPQQPFTWNVIWNPHMNVGDLMEANIALYDSESNFVGRTGIAISLGYLRALLQDALQRNATANGRLALYEPDGLVIAASHGRYDTNQRFPMAAIGDPDLEGAAAHLQQAPTDLCPTFSGEVTLSVDYFIDVAAINDTHVSVRHPQWCVLLLTPQANVLGPVQQSHRFAILFVSITTSVVTLLSTAFGLVLTRHIHRLAQGLHALRRYDFPAARQACRACTVFRELRSAQHAYDALVDAMDAFRKYVPEAVVRGLLLNRIQPVLGMAEEVVAVAFMDLEDFSAMCQQVPIEEVVGSTAQLFDVCTALIHAEDGVIDKFIGDCIMALWGAPVPKPDPGQCGARSVHRLLQFLQSCPMACPRLGTRLGLRIGLHGGRCLVGNYGASGRWGYTAIGDVVNVAARLESLNKQVGTQCLISDTVYDTLDGTGDVRPCARPMGRVRLLGRQQAVALYELGAEPQVAQVAWEDALQLFAQGMFPQAMWQLSNLEDGDRPSQALMADILEEAADRDPDGTYVRLMRYK